MAKQITIHRFHFQAIKFYESGKPLEEIRLIDRTAEFYDYVALEIKKGKLISIQFLGKVAGGKSTAAAHVVAFVNEALLKRPMTIDYLLPDQIAFSRFCQTYKEKSVCVQIDEWNPMSETGLGATVEQKRLDHINKVQAQRFIHRCSCSPDVASDKSADLLIDVFDFDKKKKETYGFIRYKFLYQGEYVEQLIGHITFDVSHVLKQDWYKEYQRRKFKKMDYLNDEGIIDERQFDEARVILGITENLEGLANLGILSQSLIKAFMKPYLRGDSLNTSIIQRTDLRDDIFGTLSAIKEKNHLKQRLMKTIDKIKKTPDNKQLETEYKEIELGLQKLNQIIDTIKSDNQRILKLAEEFKQK